MSVLAVAGLLLALAPAHSQSTRLAGLARVWGEVKYVHPAMATSRIDWDAALLRAIPAVENAATTDDYRRAISGLLAELRDPVTRVIEKEFADAAESPVSAPVAVRLDATDAETAIITIPNDPSLESDPGLQAAVCGRFTEATRFNRLVLDLRSPTLRRPGWILENAIVKCASRLLSEDVTIAPARFLEHGFYMMQSVTGGPGGGLGPWPWDSGLGHAVAVVAAGSVRGEGARTPSLAFIVNGGTVDVYPLLMGLQTQHLAQVVQEGDVPTAGLMVKTVRVDDEVSIAVRHGERLRSDGGAGFLADAVVPAGSGELARQKALALLRSPRRQAAVTGSARTPLAYGAFVEDDYSETPYPDRLHRLLALFRLYGVIERFFPYKDLMDRPWGETLVDFIPRFSESRDATDYALAVCELATRIQDSHVTLASPVLDRYFGTHRPAVRVDLVEGQTVVTEVGKEAASSDLHVGDVVVSVDGEDAAARRERLARYLPASTRGRLDNKIDIQFLLGSPSRPAMLEVRDPSGVVRQVAVSRTLEGPAPRSRPRTGRAYTVLASGYGYVDLQRLEAKDVDAAFETIRDAPGTIFDMRGYPTGGAAALIPRLALPGARPGVIGGSIGYDGVTGSFGLEETSSTLPQEPPSNDRYAGRIVVLVDGSTQSAAEHVCALIKSAASATFIGSRTSGANGGVTRTILPGGIVVNFTGQSVRHADGSQLQRVGIVPQIEARLTLAGVRAGRDDVLQRAIEYLSRGTD